MSLKKNVVFPLIVAVLAFLIQIIDQLLSPFMNSLLNLNPEFPCVKGFGWIAFQSWAVYFLAGGTVQGGVKSIIGYLIGIGGSILIMNLAGVFGSLGFFAVPLAVSLVACALIFLEKAGWFSFIPAMFIGAGAYFAFMNYVPGATFTNAVITEIVFCIIGLIFGYATLTLRAAFEKRMK